MAHYAILDENNVVINVISGREEDEIVEGISDWEKHYGDFFGTKCVRTSCNSNIRIRFAEIGMVYNEELDAFILPKCHDEATLNTTTCDWDCTSPDHTVEV
jgi:hypothetical protein